jgi:AcrR family transcriptional regulator
MCVRGQHVKVDRRQRNHEQMKGSILDAARAIMREEGVAGLSIQELARRMDMAAPSLYNYFRNKMDIYDALFRLGFTLFARHMEESTTGATTWQEGVRRYLESYMSFALEHPELYQLCFERPVPGFVPTPESMAASLDVLRRGYESVAAWRDAMQSGLSDRETVDLVLAMMHGLTALHMANEPHLPLGQGRFGALVPAAVALFAKAWSAPAVPSEGEKR